jgi:predicted permease
VQFFTRLLERLRSTAGVQSVAALAGLPPKRQVDANDTDIDGYTAPSDNQGPFENVDYYQAVTVGSLEALGIPVVEGRSFEPTDEAGGPVVLINQTMAKTFWQGKTPIGGRVRPGGPNTPWMTVVGVVRDVKQGGLEAKTGTELFFNLEQLPRVAGFAYSQMNVVMRTSLPLSSLSSQVQQAVASMDPTLPVINLQTMDDVFSESTARPRFLAQLLGGFALLALVLAAVGVFGLVSFTVAQRTREIGIRVALGAAPRQVLLPVVREGIVLALAGITIGLAGAFLAARALSAFLFGVGATDPVTFSAVALLMLIVASLASYIPSRRALKVDPVVALRAE